MESPYPPTNSSRADVIQGWLDDIQRALTPISSTTSKRKASRSLPEHRSSHLQSPRSQRKRARQCTPPTEMSSTPGRGRGMQRSARPPIGHGHADEDAPMSMPDASSDAGQSQYSAGLQFHNILGSTPVPSFPSVVSSASGQRSPKRRRSPTKPVRTPADLHMAETPVHTVSFSSQDQVPPSLHSLIHASRRIRKGHKTIPISVAEQVAATVDASDAEVDESWLVDTGDYALQDEALITAELVELQSIAAASEEGRKDGAHEVVWNEEVHARLLAVALAPFRGRLRHKNVTTVDILPEYLPKANNTALPLSEAASTGTVSLAASQTGATTLQTKRVDYVIVLDDEQVRTASFNLLRRQFGTPAAAESVNHVVDHNFLRYRPIAVSIETKSPDGSELGGITQLGMWAAAHAMRLRAARGGGGGSDDQTQLALPLLLVSGSMWYLRFFVDRGDAFHIYELKTHEESTTLVGCYRVVALIRELGRWSTDVYRPWFCQAILGIGNC